VPRSARPPKNWPASQSSGWPAWVEEQLQPAKEDPEADKRIANHRMRIEYEFEGEMAPAMMVPGGKMSMIGGEKSAMMAEAPADNGAGKIPRRSPSRSFKSTKSAG